jgi:hypothetical protein
MFAEVLQLEEQLMYVDAQSMSFEKHLLGLQAHSGAE